MEKLMYIERYDVPFQPSASADKIKDLVKRANGIKSIVFAAKDSEPNSYATTILLIADEGSYLIDTSGLTMERNSRELDVLKLFDVIKEVGALNKTKFVTSRVSNTDHLPAIEAAALLNRYPVKLVFPNWRAFKAIYTEKYVEYTEHTYAARWEELCQIS
jgi:hypothetical protein